LLHFPQAGSPNMAFGNAVHATLEAAQKAFKQNGERRSIDNLLEDFSKALHACRLSSQDEAHFETFGHKVLRQYFAERYESFRQEEHFEFDLSSRQLVVEGARLTGKIDRITPLGDDNYRVSDFKTGKPMLSWEASDPHRQIRMYHYKQQLAFYRLLLERSQAFGVATRAEQTAIEFVQPGSDGQLVPLLEYQPSDEEIARLCRIVKGVWQCMQTLELPDVSIYPPTLQGIRDFEDSLSSD